MLKARFFLVSTSIAVNQPSSSKTIHRLPLIFVVLPMRWVPRGRCLVEPWRLLENIEPDNSLKQSERCYSVFKHWTEVCGSAATYECLARALQHPMVGLGRLAVKYRGVSRDSHQGR